MDLGDDVEAYDPGQAIDPEDARFMPLGVTLSEAFVLFHGLACGLKHGGFKVVRSRTLISGRDRYVLAACLLIDLYMREKIQLHSWELELALLRNEVRQIFACELDPMAPLWITELSDIDVNSNRNFSDNEDDDEDADER